MQSSKLAAAASKPLAAALRAGARRQFIAGAAYNAAKKLMPKISETERVALGRGPRGKASEFRAGGRPRRWAETSEVE